MVEISRGGGIVRYDANPTGEGIIRPNFNEEPNARILLRKINNQVRAINFLETLRERLEKVGDDFLNFKASSQLSSHETVLVVTTARTIFNEKEAASLNSRQKEAVNDFFSSLIEKLALVETGKVAEQNGLTTVIPRDRLAAASNSQNPNENFLREFSNLLGRTYINYPGYGEISDIDHSLAELFEGDLNLRPVDKAKNKNPLREILIRTLRVADDHFKCEKDHNEQSPSRMVLGALGRLRGNQSHYEELGGLNTEANGITLERGFAQALENLLKTYQIVQPARKFQGTAYPYLNTLALEAATDKIRNPV
ncbi:MAG: hypothetical protein VKK32_00810 [Candidatus Melainabacteria bacterium]|nr:hypothetical protein [Candidatus Melainabacteria bacterium]